MSIDWTLGMQQTFSYYQVDPISWRDIKSITTVTSSEVKRDETLETLETATIDAADELGEIYVRIYLDVTQKGEKARVCLGTFLVQTPKDGFNGKVHNRSYDAYSPLLELKDNPPPIGYYIPKGSNIMRYTSLIVEDNLRAPVVSASSSETLVTDFVAEDSDTWLSFASDLMANASFRIGLDDTSRVIFYPDQEDAALQPIWIYNDDNSSILKPQIDVSRDLYGIPNVVEVLYTDSSDIPVYKRIVNDDPDSPISTVTRGREIIHRDTSPSIKGNPTDTEINRYATNLLKQLSTVEYQISYEHGYCPARVGDCVVLNYTRAGLNNVKARVTSQRISCVPGCPVEETAVYTKSLWG